MWVYVKDGEGYHVGFYDPRGGWHCAISLDNVNEAEMRVAFLNGGVLHVALEDHLQQIAQHLEALVVKGEIH